MLKDDFPETENGSKVIGLLRSSTYVWVMNPFNETQFLKDAVAHNFEAVQVRGECIGTPTIIEWPE